MRYITSAELIEELTAAAGDKTLPKQVRRFTRCELLIIDELGFDKLERAEYPDASSLLYRSSTRRNQKASTALVTNIQFDDWTITSAIRPWPWRCWTASCIERSFTT